MVQKNNGFNFGKAKTIASKEFSVAEINGKKYKNAIIRCRKVELTFDFDKTDSAEMFYYEAYNGFKWIPVEIGVKEQVELMFEE